MITLGLGCNIGDRLENLREALVRIKAIVGLEVIQVSPVYESDAMLLDGSPNIWDKPFLNLAISIKTDLNPKQLLAKSKDIELEMGRVDTYRWSPRIIDIDILTWHNEIIDTDTLKIPHAGIVERPFVLWPLTDLIPNWCCCDPSCPNLKSPLQVIAKKFGSRFDGKAPFSTRQIAHRIDTPRVMGILNVTPDSFSDGGKFNVLENASRQVEELFYAGADIIDVGAESTRPGSQKISAIDEWSRLEPLLNVWNSLWRGHNYEPKLSIDTYKPEIVKKLLPYPISYINDVGGLTNSEMIEIVKDGDFKIIFMHNLGLPANPNNVVAGDLNIILEVYQWAEGQLNKLIQSGISQERLIFDPGIGFGKIPDHSLSLIKNIRKFNSLGIPVLVGHSRKSFMNKFTAKKLDERDFETAVLSGFLADQGVDYLRVHNVDYSMRLLKLAEMLKHE